MPDKPSTRTQLVRDTVVFQVKLFVDGLRDLVLSPVSIIAAFFDFVTGNNRFYRLMDLGRQSEGWINLFGTHDDAGLDDAVSRVEELVREQYKKGNMSATAKEAVNRALDTLATGKSVPDKPVTEKNEPPPE